MDLIRTLLRPPTRGTELIERSKLDRIAGRILQRRLSFVKAPAGYGKSSLLQRWYLALGGGGVLTGWLSLDQGASDLRSFFSYAGKSKPTSIQDIFGVDGEVAFITGSRFRPR